MATQSKAIKSGKKPAAKKLEKKQNLEAQKPLLSLR
jgi:hypothetical protein